MQTKTWVYQIKSQVEKHGKAKASWYVGYLDPDGKRKTKSCGPGTRGKRDAERLADQIHSQLVTETYEKKARKTWAEFRQSYEKRILSRMDARSLMSARDALDQFEKISKPNRMVSITRETVDDFVSKRRLCKGRMSKTISPATVNKDLRYIRAALRVAHDWELIAKVPKVCFLKQPKKNPTFVTPEHFAAIYQACDRARLPCDVPNVPPCDWWRALIATIYLTGWRISQVLALKWDDVNLKEGTALSQAEDNKGRRDVQIPLHPTVVEYLEKLTGSFDTHVFPWNHHERTLWAQFTKIQQAAKLADGSPLPQCGKEGWYGFHDLRRGFATQNAETMNLFELQQLMQHQSLETTRGYVNMAKQLNRAVDGLFVPDVLRKPAASM